MISIWTATSGNVPSDKCAQRRLKSACACAQSDQSICCMHEDTLHPWLFKMCQVKILIRLCECAGWSESSLGTRVRWYVFWRFGSFGRCQKKCVFSRIGRYESAQCHERRHILARRGTFGRVKHYIILSRGTAFSTICMCAQRRLRSVCAVVQSDQSLRSLFCG